MRVVVIDPHITKPYSFAVFDDHKLIARGHSSLDALHTTLGREVDLVIIETQYFRDNVKTMAGLATSKGKVLGWCETHDIAYIEVWPSQWQAHMKMRKKPKDSKGDAAKRKQEVRAKVAFNFEEKNEHLQDCIMMYSWWRVHVHEKSV